MRSVLSSLEFYRGELQKVDMLRSTKSVASYHIHPPTHPSQERGFLDYSYLEGLRDAPSLYVQ